MNNLLTKKDRFLAGEWFYSGKEFTNEYRYDAKDCSIYKRPTFNNAEKQSKYVATVRVFHTDRVIMVAHVVGIAVTPVLNYDDLNFGVEELEKAMGVTS